MNPLSPFADQWSSLSALLDEALNLPVDEREAWLSGLAGERARHRDALRALLSRQQPGAETDDFLHSLPRLDPPAGPADGGASPGSVVGPYRLLALIGQGGMGSVWLAERADGLMQRRVALKLPRIAWGGSLAERLAREREILASLAHPHIARLYDAGVDDQGRPFLAMEHVHGQPIDRYCAERALPLRERVGLLLQVMAAVSHAHARLVVHRDLKPGNILVTPEGHASLLDFGIAKLMDGEQAFATALTELSGRALTVDYASPEQIRGEPLGTGSDVYSMGVVAFEVLSGARPYRLKRGSTAELEEAIATTDAPLASSVAADPARRKALRGDLDAILNRALKKVPVDRYPTMEAFAEDLRRWLGGEAVQARPDALSYRASKFVGRHRWQVAAGAAVAVSLVAGTVVSVWQAREARAAAGEARVQATTAAAVKRFMERVFLVSSGNQADPKRARETTARELLDQGAARLETDLKDAPEARLELYATLSNLYNEMALHDPAQSLAERRLALATRLHGMHSLQEAQAQIALASLNVGGDKQAQALALLDRAGATLATMPPAADRELERTRIELDAAFGDSWQRQEPAKALPYIDRALATANAARYPAERVNILQTKGAALTRLTRYPEALAALSEAGAMIEKDHSLGWNTIVRLYSGVADLQNRMGQRAQAEAMYAKAIALSRDGAGEGLDLPVTYNRLSISQYMNGRYAEAVRSSGEAAAWARQQPENTLLGLFPATLMATHGRVLRIWGHPEEALAVIDAALARIARQTAHDPAPAAEHEGPLLAFRAEVLVDLGRLAEAGKALDRSGELIGDDHTGQAKFVRDVRRAYWVASGQAAKALADFEQSPHQTGNDRSAPVRWQALHASFEMAAGQTGAALRDAQAALAIIQADPDRTWLRYWESLAALAQGQALLTQGDAQAALAPLRRAEELDRAMFDPVQSLALAQVLEVEGQALAARHDTEGAARKSAEAQAIRARHRA